MKSLFALSTALTLVSLSEQRQWNRDGNIMWSLNCDFFGNDIRNVAGPGEDCSNHCRATGGCTSFTWADNVCYLKNGRPDPNSAVDKNGAVCGYVESSGGNRQWTTSGNVRWALDCDFFGNDIKDAPSSGEECGPMCANTNGCTSFTWTKATGKCFMKNGRVSEGNAVSIQGPATCGFLINGPTPPQPPISGNIRTTFWADQTDAGGCSLPNGDYVIADALALGQEDALSGLRWRNGLCGQVLEINCGNGPVQAIVASTCNVGSNTCGVDLIRRTWNRATGNKSPGIEKCSVRLSGSNAMQGGPQCFVRPDSGNVSPYYGSVGVFNVNGRVVRGARLSGVEGRFMSGSGYFEFNSGGRDLFKPDSEVVFSFEDGSAQGFHLRDCRNSGVKIFR